MSRSNASLNTAQRPFCPAFRASWLGLWIFLVACGDPSESSPAAPHSGALPPDKPVSATSAPLGDPGQTQNAASPRMGARSYAVTVFDKPSHKSKRLGYLRVGAKVQRASEPASRRGCKGAWYKIAPQGYVCTGPDATIELDDPLVRAGARRPQRNRVLPYRYGFVRAVLPMYLRIPTAKQQYKREFKLEQHLDWFKEHRAEIQKAELGAQDVPTDAHARVIKGKALGELGRRMNSTELSVGQLFGGKTDADAPPFWLRGNERLIPNISGFEVPAYALFADRARRHTGFAFVGSFQAGESALKRRFAVTTDLRLVPTSKVKPDSASPWHGVELGDALKPPFVFIRLRGAQAYGLDEGEPEPLGPLVRRSVHRLKGKVKRLAGKKYYALDGGRWVRDSDASLVIRPRKLPKAARRGEKWIEIDLSEQTLILWEGERPVYATLVSTGRPAVGDPKTTTATPRGVFRIYAKHISATMDSDEGSGRRLNETKTLKPGDEGYVPQRGDGIYGVSRRRGHGLFKLRDVPHIQYFKDNYALHGAYWHDVFGIPRSHGCINLAPVDSHRVFRWTTPHVPDEWHGMNTDHGTIVLIHK